MNGAGSVSGGKSSLQPGVYLITVTLSDGVGGGANRSTAAAVTGGAGFDSVSGPAILLDSTVAEGRISNQSLPLSVPKLLASSIDSVFASLIDSNRDHWFWSI